MYITHTVEIQGQHLQNMSSKKRGSTADVHHARCHARTGPCKNWDTWSNSACALEGHVDPQRGCMMAARPACAWCRAGAAGPSKRYSDMLLDTTTPLLWMPRISVENQSLPNDEALTRGWYTRVPTARKPRCLLLVTSLAKLQSRSTTMFLSASADKADAAAAGGGGKARVRLTCHHTSVEAQLMYITSRTL
jgi:hypothetical protein